MQKKTKNIMKKWMVISLAVMTAFTAISCSKKQESGVNLIDDEHKKGKIVNLFGPMEKSSPDADNIARTAFDMTVIEAEEALGLTVEYRTYTAENYQEKTYDDVVLERVRKWRQYRGRNRCA